MMHGFGQQLIRHKKYKGDFIMEEIDLNKVAESWIKMHHFGEGSVEYNANYWAYCRLIDLCDDDPEKCFKVIELIRSIDGSDLILSNLAAGPLEDLLSKHGELFIDRIEKYAQTDPQLKKLLGAVWQNSISDAIWERIKALVDSSW